MKNKWKVFSELLPPKGGSFLQFFKLKSFKQLTFKGFFLYICHRSNLIYYE